MSDDPDGHIPVPEGISYSYRKPRRTLLSGRAAKTGALFGSALGLAIALGRPRKGS